MPNNWTTKRGSSIHPEIILQRGPLQRWQIGAEPFFKGEEIAPQRDVAGSLEALPMCHGQKDLVIFLSINLGAFLKSLECLGIGTVFRAA
ncbi:MAG: hypothetical protein BGN84_08670 [Afipia sp. 62-7]|nr:MAG: hypothetical protein BGN84_08670 [Afipia sp. 62-7]